jgi:site-specific DNA-methyltransferase (adenine-specific)
MTDLPDGITVLHGDSLQILATLEDQSVDAVVTDPPYGLEFMGKEWDSFAPAVEQPTRSGWDKPTTNARISKDSGAHGRVAFHKRRHTFRCTGCQRRDAFKNEHECAAPWQHEWTDSVDVGALTFQAWSQAWAAECLRVLKPGGHLLAFGGTRTWHRLACAIEDAGFEVRDSIAWMYGSGFPKSLDVSKAIEKALRPRIEPDLTLEYQFTAWVRTTGVTAQAMNEATDSNMGGHYVTAVSQPAIPTRAMLERMRHLFADVPQWVEDVVDQREREKAEARERQEQSRFLDSLALKTDPLSVKADAAREWQGWGTALKPAHEPIVVARKPLVGTVAANVLEHGTGALNIDACRIGTDGGTTGAGVGPRGNVYGDGLNGAFGKPIPGLGRWPANVVLDPDQAAELDRQSGSTKGTARVAFPGGKTFGGSEMKAEVGVWYGDTGGASRFFYVAKAPTKERPTVDGVAHPTVKPVTLMRYLVRLVTPPGGLVLDPFAGSGTTAEACHLEGFRCVTIERDPDYVKLIHARLANTSHQPPLL